MNNRTIQKILHKQKPILEELGKVTVTWSLLEWSLRLILWKLSGIDDNTGIAISAHVNFPTLINSVKSLVRLNYSHEAIDEINSILSEIDSAYAKRNVLIHSIWFRPEEINGNITFLKSHIKSRGKIIKEVNNITIEDIENISAEIINSGQRLISVAKKYDLWPDYSSLHIP